MKCFRVIKLMILFLVNIHAMSSQNEFRKWYFGTQAGLDFATSPPTVLTNGAVGTSEGVATICDANGNLLFYTDGTIIYNSAHAQMANGTALFGGSGSSTQAATIVKQPGNSNVYYVFTTAQGGGNTGVCYSIVDMNLAAGMGSVTVKNIQLYTPTCEKQVVVRHCNGHDAWIVTHHVGSNEFRTYLLNSTGVVLPPVVSAIGEAPAGNNGFPTLGQLKISPDGKKLAMGTYSTSTPISLGSGGLFLFDFDAATGIVSNSLTVLSGTNLTIDQGVYGVEFSPDGTKLYCNTIAAYGSNTSALFQWNICATNNAAIIASQYSVSLGNALVGSLQKALDGKIYMAIATSQSLSVINNPNASGSAMNFVLNGLSVAPGTSRLGLPNYINTYVKPAVTPFTNTVACQSVTFAVPPVPTFSSGCSSTPYQPSSYLWNFGEPGSGTANTSTLTSPVHTYSALGTYSVSLILYSNCTNDTIRKVITISTAGPTVNVAGNFNICKGDKRTYTVTGATSYKWSNNVTTTTTALSPTTTSVYTVTGTTNGCSASKVFTVTVNPCLGISAIENAGQFNVFPNPFNDLLSVEAENPSNMTIRDMDGKVVLEQRINIGRNEINTGTLKPGVYFVLISNSQIWRGRLVKVE